MAKFSQFTGKTQSREEQIKDKFDQYKDMSHDQLQSTLLGEVAKQKANGNFDYDGLKSMVNSLQGVLPERDYQNILALLESLK